MEPRHAASSLLVVALSLVALLAPARANRTCAVDNFPVMDNFDKERYLGKWYAVSKKDPEGLFLQDNISADYTLDEDGNLVATSRGRVKLFGFWEACADMVASYIVAKPEVKSKMFMNYQGLASYLSSGGDDYWVIDTDYDSYALTYSCRSRDEEGLCADGYSLVFARTPRGLPPGTQRIIRARQDELCLLGHFTPVVQNGACP
ncbi:purpurin-like [Petromyzon marinus]|uniref:purpurin-like n=1 Tax=Petromyzon marinus TaxID=7757 RepID=UPI003F730373